MSVDYFLISKEKKVYMPFFTMSFDSIWQADKRYVFDFIIAAGTDVWLVSEYSDDLPGEIGDGWTLINSYEPYVEKVG